MSGKDEGVEDEDDDDEEEEEDEEDEDPTSDVSYLQKTPQRVRKQRKRKKRKEERRKKEEKLKVTKPFAGVAAEASATLQPPHSTHRHDYQ